MRRKVLCLEACTTLPTHSLLVTLPPPPRLFTARPCCRHELERGAQACKRLAQHRNIHVLGSLTAKRAPVLSFMVFHPETGRYLHHNFVCCVLNDVFGIQARGGCACAGPYAQRLMGMDKSTTSRYASKRALLLCSVLA